jgi:hypothetical protein
MKLNPAIVVAIAAFNLFGCVKSNCAEAKKSEPLKRFSHPIFYLYAPAEWTRNESSEFFSISAPHDVAAVTAAAYSGKDGTLEQFAAHRFASVDSLYSQVGSERRSVSPKSECIVREYEGTWPGEARPTFYVVACIRLSGVFVSLTITTTRAEFESNRARYEAIIISVANEA